MKKGRIIPLAAVMVCLLFILAGCTEGFTGGDSTNSTATTSSTKNTGLTNEEAVAITKDVIARCNQIFYTVLSYPSLLEGNDKQTIPDNRTLCS